MCGKNSMLAYFASKFLNLNTSLSNALVYCSSPLLEEVAGAVKGRSGADIGVSPLNSVSCQVSDRAIQRQPVGRSAGGGRRLQTRWESTRTVCLQGTRPRQQHNTVSLLNPDDKLSEQVVGDWLMK